MAGRSEIFISYAHEDEAWRERFEQRINSVSHNYSIRVWSDRSIEAGANWAESIEDAIARSRMALMLVSSAFLESEFIKNEELPKILERHRRRGLYIRWVPLEDALIEETPLAQIQASIPANEPLMLIENEAKINQTVNDIVREILDVLASRPGVPDSDDNELPYPVGADLIANLGHFEEVGRGDFSVIFKARRADEQAETVALKVFGAGGKIALNTERFREPFVEAQRLRNEAFIRIRDYDLDADMPAIVMDYVDDPTLVRFLARRQTPLSPSEAARLLCQLADALAEAHDLGLVNGNIGPGDIYIDEDARTVRLSPVSFCTSVGRAERARGIVTLSGSQMTLMPPEIYHGWQVGPATDQYLLALIGIIMLYGKTPVFLRQPADLHILDTFYEGPDWWAEQPRLRALHEFWFETLRPQAPQLTVVLRRMLSRRPRFRFAGMREVALNLAAVLEAQERPPLHIDEAKASFGRYCHENHEFYARFYERLRGKNRTITRLLDQKIESMEAHYDILDEAIERLLNFRPGREPTTLSRLAKRHARMGLDPDYFDLFGDAFVETLEAQEVESSLLDSWRATLKPGLEYMKEVTRTRAAEDEAARSDAGTKAAVSRQPKAKRSGTKAQAAARSRSAKRAASQP